MATIRNDVATLLRLYNNYHRAQTNMMTYLRTHPNNNNHAGLIRHAANITAAEHALRLEAVAIIRRHTDRERRLERTLNGRNIRMQALTTYIPQLLRRLDYIYTMSRVGVNRNVINNYIRHI
jgi:hypothetical protein